MVSASHIFFRTIWCVVMMWFLFGDEFFWLQCHTWEEAEGADGRQPKTGGRGKQADRESCSCKSPSLSLKAFGCPRSPSTGDLTESQECIRGELGINSVGIALRYSGGSYYMNGTNCPHKLIQYCCSSCLTVFGPACFLSVLFNKFDIWRRMGEANGTMWEHIKHNQRLNIIPLLKILLVLKFFL